MFNGKRFLSNLPIAPPNLFIIGAPKAGTTSVCEYLVQHPDIYGGQKEPRYWDRNFFYDFESDFPLNSYSDYLKLYSGAESQGSKFRIDASVFIMYQVESIEAILRQVPEARFIVCLRDPSDAARSMFLQHLKYSAINMREVAESFEDVWSLMSERAAGREYPPHCRNKNLFRYDRLFEYDRILPKIEAVIPAQQIRYVDFAVLKKDPIVVCNELANWLGLPIFFPQIRRHNEAYIVPGNHWTRLIERIAPLVSNATRKLRGSRRWSRTLRKAYLALKGAKQPERTEEIPSTVIDYYLTAARCYRKRVE